jgi:hypothetical protein
MKGPTIMNNLRFTSLSFAALASLALVARERPGHPRSASSGDGRAAACAPATAFNELDLNNVRARIETGGNMWQNRGSAGGPAYEVPKTPAGTSINAGPNALFAGALWMGGLSPDNILKLAAVRFRQEGNDYWPGPLVAYDTVTHSGPASIDGTVCTAYDKTWKTMRVDAERQSAYFACLADPSCDINVNFAGYSIPSYFYDWPAHGDVTKGQDYHLAPFYDNNGDDVYDPNDGDYPGYDLKKVIDCKSKRREDLVPLFGDQNIWWVFNDKGNTHTESGGQPIGMEIRAQAFEFATNDEVNNMSFYNYVLINQGTQTLTETYFGQWVDVDLGGASDDYVGCDVQRGLGYGYNGDAVDEDANGYLGYGGPNPPPPAIGVDFFEGPYQDYDQIDNPLTTNCDSARANLGIPYQGIGIGYGDSVVDNERYGMRAFVYHNNAAGAQGDPDNAGQYYGYLRSIWGDNTPMTYGGSGYSTASGGTRAYYMFPGSSDTLGWGTNCIPQTPWDEVTAGNAPGDRRFIQSAGPFTLEPGAYNNITVGVVYARATSGDVQASVDLMRKADDKAQSLFDNCFRILNGPDAPDVTIQELDKELILYITNPLGSNNYNESYHEVDPTIPPTASDREYRFQGYQIFQVANSTVSPDQLQDQDKARLVAQVDIHDGVTQLINWIQDPQVGQPIPTQMVAGSDSGVVHSFRILTDKFATVDPQLKNFQTYYYMAIAYGYNNYQGYNPLDHTGQPYPYLAGRKAPAGAIKVYAGIPHKTSVENGGTVLNAQYGDGFALTRIEGQGNGGLKLALDNTTLNQIANAPVGTHIDQLVYQKGKGPVNIKVVDPLKVPVGQFELWVKDTTALPIAAASTTGFDSYSALNDASWMLVRLSDNPTPDDTIRPQTVLSIQNEQLIPQWGISVTMTQTAYRILTGGTLQDYTNFLGSAMEPSDGGWYAGIPDQEGETMQNWIRSGTALDDALVYKDMPGIDNEQQYERVLGGTWGPWPVAGNADLQPCGTGLVAGTRGQIKIKELPSVQVVITPDKSKWTRCVVVEESASPDFTVPAGVAKLALRPVPSVDKNGIPTGSPGCNEAEATLTDGQSMSWFPGYAVDLETGERLNMFFGENSFLGGNAGRDMIWNPSDVLLNSDGQAVFGGQHWIYVCLNRQRLNNGGPDAMPQYDAGAFIRTNLASAAGVAKVFRSVAWVGSALMKPGMSMKSPQEGLVPSEVRLRMDVSKPYTIYADPFAGYTPSIPVVRNGGLPLYSFSTGESVAHTDVTDVGKSGLDLIGVVPNPYYGYSGYETTRLDNRVKFINLPKTCTISIYTVSGTLVRKFKKDNELTYLDWDLKNNYNVPISGGTYLCHIDAPGLGEKVIKWFGVMRPVDLQNF